jgi:serine/threonine-protein kinase
MLAKLNHPSIATIYELHRSDEDLLMVMEFVRGESLDQFVQRSGPVEPERAAYLVSQVLDAIGHAHAAGIIHRDLKPSNVMVTEHGTVKIMDFGIARVRGAEHMTSDGYMMGTPAYMSPEQVLCEEVDGRSDLYSVGVMFYRLLTGKLPFEADTAIGMVQKQISDTPTPARLHRADLPAWTVAILDRALAKSPADRYQTAEELRGALLDAIQGGAIETTSLMPTAALGRPPKPPARPPEPDAETAMAVALPPEPATQMATMPPTVPARLPRAAVPAPVAAVEPKPIAPADPKPASVAVPLKAVSPAAPRRTSNTPAIAAAIVAAVVAATIVIGFVTWRRSQTAPPATSASPDAAVATPSAPPPPTTPAPDTPASTAAAPPPSPATADAAATPPASAAPPPPPTPDAPARNPSAAGATAAPPGSQAASARPPRTARGNAPPVVETPAPEPAPAPPVIVATTPPKPAVQFRAKMLVKEEDKSRERDATVRLADGQVTVTGPDRAILSAIPYDAVLSVIYSRSKQPLWDGPAGATPIQQVDGGAFGFFKGGRHWVSLRTKERFVVLRVEENQVPSVLSLIEERTGKATIRVAEPKGNP